MANDLTLGPILFHWPADRKLDFYARIADEAPVDTVYLGEVVCSKRAPFFEQHYADVVERLQRGGKTVVLSSLCEVVLKRERRAIEDFCDIDTHEIEVNNSSALLFLTGRRHRIGPMMNVYNEATMRHLAQNGATHFSLPIELPQSSATLLAKQAADLGAGVEMQVFGRAPLAVSARCYHARAHGRTKDNCQFVCEKDLDGMPLKTLDGKPFLAVNGVQTLSQTHLNYLGDLPDLQAAGLTHFRLSPQTLDMVVVATLFRDVLDGKLGAEDAAVRLSGLAGAVSLSNGFWHGRPGHVHV